MFNPIIYIFTRKVKCGLNRVITYFNEYLESKSLDKSENAKAQQLVKIVVAILFAKAAVATFSIAPFLVGSFIDHLALPPSSAGKVLSIEVYALSVSNVLAYFWISRVNVLSLAKRLLAALFLLNILCSKIHSFELLMIARAMVGALEGGLLAIGFGMISATANPNRNFGLYFSISLTVGALNVQLLPLFISSFGSQGLFLNLALYSLVAFIILMLAVYGNKISLSNMQLNQKTEHNALSPYKHDLRFVGLLIGFVLFANFLYFVGQGGLWSFFERLGQQQGVSLTNIASALSASLVAGVLGGLTATLLNEKLGQLLPIGVAICCGLLSVFVLHNWESKNAFLLAACLFNYGNNLGHAYLLGVIANYTNGPNLTVLGGAVQTLGQASGPLVAGLIVTKTDYSNVILLAAISFSVTSLIIFPSLLVWKHRLKMTYTEKSG